MTHYDNGNRSDEFKISLKYAKNPNLLNDLIFEPPNTFSVRIS